MTAALEPLLAPVRAAVARARAGNQREAAEELLGFVNGDVPLQSWVGAAAALGWFWWTGFIGEASDMVERVVLRFGGQAVAANLPPDVEFVTAVMAGARYDGTEREGRLRRMADALPAHFPLAAQLRQYADGAVDHPDWGIPVALAPRRPLLRGVAMLLPSDPAGLPRLSEADAVTLWRGAASAGDSELLLALSDAGLVPPPEAPVKWALAQVLYEAGRAGEAEAALLGARADWWPLNWWETLPRTPPLAPGLRPALTAGVIEAHLTLPVAVGAGR